MMIREYEQRDEDKVVRLWNSTLEEDKSCISSVDWTFPVLVVIIKIAKVAPTINIFRIFIKSPYLYYSMLPKSYKNLSISYDFVNSGNL